MHGKGPGQQLFQSNIVILVGSDRFRKGCNDFLWMALDRVGAYSRVGAYLSKISFGVGA